MAIVLHSQAKIEIPRTKDLEAADVDPAAYREVVFRCALAICAEPDGAEDVAQEVLLILFKAKRKLSTVDNPIAWIRRVTVRVATRYLKRRRPSDQLPEFLQSTDSPTDGLAVYGVLQQLTVEHRALLGMALSQGLSYREIAEALGIPEGTVGSQLNAAKKAFQRKWEQ